MGYWAHLDRRALFERGDVYRVAFDAERAARTPVRVAVLGAGGVAQSKYLPALAKIKYAGITANIEFDGKGDLTQGLLTIFEVKNGKWEVISK